MGFVGVSLAAIWNRYRGTRMPNTPHSKARHCVRLNFIPFHPRKLSA